MTAILSDFIILLISVSFFGGLYLIILELLRTICHTDKSQIYTFYKILLLFYLTAPVFVLFSLIRSAEPELVPVAGEDFSGFYVSQVPIAYHYYDRYPELSFIRSLFVLWAAGFALSCFLYSFLSHRQLRMLQRISFIDEDGELNKLKTHLMQEYKIHRPMSIYRCDAISSPFLCGYRQSAIFLPQAEYSQEYLEFILRHELIHCKRKDVPLKQLLIYVQCFFWFNPLIYFFVRKFNDYCEITCDEKLLGQYGRDLRLSYAQCLMSFTPNGRNLGHVTNLYSTNIMEKRIRAITKLRPGQKRNRPIFILSLIMAGLLPVILYFTLSQSLYIRGTIGHFVSERFLEASPD